MSTFEFMMGQLPPIHKSKHENSLDNKRITVLQILRRFWRTGRQQVHNERNDKIYDYIKGAHLFHLEYIPQHTKPAPPRVV